MKWDYEFEVVVVGSGNGALTSALCSHDGGVKTLVIEKSDQYGGTSATSGGGVWIPNNRYAKAENVDDSDQDARDYIKDGKTEKITFDDKTFELASTDKVQRFLDSEYYIFLVKSTD